MPHIFKIHTKTKTIVIKGLHFIETESQTNVKFQILYIDTPLWHKSCSEISKILHTVNNFNRNWKRIVIYILHETVKNDSMQRENLLIVVGGLRTSLTRMFI